MKYEVRFLVVKENLTPLLGLNTTEKMGLLTVHKENFVSVVENLEDDLTSNMPMCFISILVSFLERFTYKWIRLVNQ